MPSHGDVSHLTTAVVVYDSAFRVLLLNREEPPYRGLLGLPGGKIKAGETALAAMWRELQEETRLTPEEVECWGYVGTYSKDEMIMIVWLGAVPSSSGQASTLIWHDRDSVRQLHEEGRLAPHVYKAIQSAFAIQQESSSVARVGRIHGHLEKARNALVASFIDKSSDHGWDTYLGGQDVGIVATALGLIAIHNCGINGKDPTVGKAIEFLASRQASDGGWGTRTSCKIKDIGFTESTAIALFALSSYGHSGGDAHVSKGIRWLMGNRHGTGGWGANKHSPASSVYATAWAIRVLARYGLNDDYLHGVKWIVDTQNHDGGWGPHANVPSTAPHTAHAVLALVETSGSNHFCSDSLKKGIACLKQSFFKKGGWEDATEPIELHDDTGRLVHRSDFKHCAGPWGAVALMAAGESVFSSEVLSVLSQFAAMQRSDGAWPQASIGGNRPIWVMQDATLLMSTAIRQASIAAFELQGRSRSLEAQIERIADDIVNLYPGAPRRGHSRQLILSLLLNLTLICSIIWAMNQDRILGFLRTEKTNVWQNMLLSILCSIFAAVIVLIAGAVVSKIWRRLRPVTNGKAYFRE